MSPAVDSLSMFPYQSIFLSLEQLQICPLRICFRLPPLSYSTVADHLLRERA